MATIKSFTDIPQSKVLSKILPLESADMIYTMVNGRCTPFIRIETIEEIDEDDVLCWSLAALLGVMICPNLEEYIEGAWDLTAFTDNSLKTPIEIQDCKDPVDACYHLITKLYELKKL